MTYDAGQPCCAEYGRLVRERDTLRADLAAAQEALRPFAEIAADYERADAKSAEHHRDEDRTYKPRSDSHRISISLGDCRRARALLPARATTEGRDG